MIQGPQEMARIERPIRRSLDGAMVWRPEFVAMAIQLASASGRTSVRARGSLWPHTRFQVGAAAAIAVSPARAWRPLRSRPTTSLVLLAIDTLLSASTQQLADLAQFATIELIDRLDQAA